MAETLEEAMARWDAIAIPMGSRDIVSNRPPDGPPPSPQQRERWDRASLLLADFILGQP